MNATLPEVTIQVNGAARLFRTPATVAVVLDEMGLAQRRGIAVALDDEVVPRSQWSERPLRGGERLLIIQATQGG